MSEFISKKVITNSVASNHSGGGGGGDLWLLNTTFVALDTIGSVCQSGMNIHEDAMVAVLNSPSRMIGALFFLVPLFLILLYGVTKIRIF